MKNRSFEVLCHKQIWNARRGSKEKSAMKHFLWQSCQPRLEHFPKSILYMLYTILKLRKSRIQCFKRYIIRRWNEGVTAIASQSLQAEGRILHDCEITLLLWNDFAAILHSAMEFLLKFPDISRHVGSRELQVESQLHRAAKSAFCCEVISQPFLCVYEISQTSFSPAKWSLVLPDIWDQHFEIFFFRFLLSKSPNSPYKPPIIGFLSY